MIITMAHIFTAYAGPQLDLLLFPTTIMPTINSHFQPRPRYVPHADAPRYFPWNHIQSPDDTNHARRLLHGHCGASTMRATDYGGFTVCYTCQTQHLANFIYC